MFCREHVAQLREHQEELETLGARIVAIGLGDRNYARIFREDTGIQFPLLIDENREAYAVAELKSANIFRLFSKETLEHRKRASAAGHKQHKLGQNILQLGGTFVFGPGNIDRYSKLSASTGENAPIADLLAVLRAH